MAEALARRPRVDARFFNGIAIVVATSTALWWVVGVFKFSASGTAADFFLVAFFGLLFVIALAVATYVVALGPGALLWAVAMRLGQRLGLTERLIAQLAAPLVALLVAVICLVAFTLSTGSSRNIDLRLVKEAMLVALPSAVVAEIYVCLVWPKGGTRKGTEA